MVIETGSRLVVVSNRLPFVLSQGEDGGWTVCPGSGGLVTALVPVLQRLGGVWIGWPGTVEEDQEGGLAELERRVAQAMQGADYTIKPVLLTAAERDGFYYGFSNEIIWPLFHDLVTHCQFDPAYWSAYQKVMTKFADAVVATARRRDFVWVHDYQLMGVAQELRARGFEAPLGFYLHIPFPPADIFAALPWREDVLRGLLEYDLIGFQTDRDREHFLDSLGIFVEEADVSEGESVHIIRYAGRSIKVGTFPIGIDFHEFARDAASPEVNRLFRELKDSLEHQHLFLGVDRLDYTKGIPERLEAFRHALRRYPELRRKVTFIQVVVPSREDIPRYQALKERIEQLVGEVNGEFTRTPWVPVHYHYRSLERAELLAYYRAADLALVTPLKDGMNLVAKEYCAANLEEDGVLLLSEFAGAASQLGEEALLVNPHNIEEVAAAIHRAFHMSAEERRRRMRRMREIVRRHDIHRWVDRFLEVAAAPVMSFV